MRSAAFPILAMLALAAASCSAQPTPITPTAAVQSDTQIVSTDTPEIVVSTDTPTGPLGSISGTIKPPPVQQPATSIRIYARQKTTAKVFGTEIPVDATAYTISGLPMGTYTVFAWYYPDGVPGAYTSAGVDVVETSSDQLKCSNSLIEIVLTERKPDFQGADIGCWAGNYFIFITPLP
ncbi:MAG: hypothetical protein JW748_09615 [Anaerolineales bacterium]|nr:hypothetical protein [Anaerolineales bacterium]